MKPKTLEEVIRQYIPLQPYPSSTGWHPVLCKVCNDHGRKGLRGGFKFDGETVAYHCFNCGPSMNTIYDPVESKGMPKKMQTILHEFGVPLSEWQGVLLENLARRGEQSNDEVSTYKDIEPDIIPLPKHFYLLSNAESNDKWAEVARWYLTEERNVDPTSYPFMLSRYSDDKFLKKWNNRLIIPIYKDNELIYYQGRDLTDLQMKKYESPSMPKDKVLYGFDKLTNHSTDPLYITEGWFDAEAIDGVAIIGNELSSAHIQWLNRSPRKKVYVPDKSGDGQRSAITALDQGWSISTPDTGNCKDMSEAVKKYGKLYVMKTLVDNTVTGFAANTKLGIYCEHKTKNKNDNKR